MPVCCINQAATVPQKKKISASIIKFLRPQVIMHHASWVEIRNPGALARLLYMSKTPQSVTFSVTEACKSPDDPLLFVWHVLLTYAGRFCQDVADIIILLFIKEILLFLLFLLLQCRLITGNALLAGVLRLRPF